jgi:hypothetical protein
MADMKRSDERAFLHSISTPVSTLGLLIETLEADPETIERFRSCHAQLTKLIRERRQLLIEAAQSTD